ncbi:MAG: DUF3750 domain-containing protein [Tagaea sp.]|nr:DUF3750 domain-containing protein [Tagaea sp.]
MALFRTFKLASLCLAVLLAGPGLAALSRASQGADWRTASREALGLAPDPATHPQAMIRVYGARALGWRGAFGVHTWVALKPEGAPSWTTYEIIGWRSRWGGDGLVVTQGAPDRRWFGAEPELYAHLEGEGTQQAIARALDAALAYPYRREYGLWPGPNSNTFTAMVARAAPELRLDLPPTAIGKDYLGETRFAGAATSGTGVQISLWGLLGVVVAAEEGIELNVAGLTLGVDPLGLGLKFPGIGRIGPPENPARKP